MTATIGTAPAPQPRKTYFHDDDRAALAAGYRRLADLIEADQCPMPATNFIGFLLYHPDRLAELQASFGDGRWVEGEMGYDTARYRTFRGMCAGLPIELWISQGHTGSVEVERRHAA